MIPVAVVTNGAHRTGAPLSLLALLHRAPPDVRLDILSIGEGPLLPEFASIAESLEVLTAPRTRGVRPARLWEEWQLLRGVWAWGKRRRHSVLFVNTVEFEAALLLAARWRGSSVVAVRETTAYLSGPRGRIRRAALLRGRSRLAAVGDAQAASWRDALGRHVERMLNVYERHGAAVLRPPGRPLRFLYVGGKSPTKGVDYAVEAFHRANLSSDARLLVAGGDFVPSEDAGIQWLGEVPSLGRRLGHLADVLVATSRRESFSRTVIEAALAGVPAVAWRTGGYVEQLETLGGWLVEPFDVDALADRMVALARITDREYMEMSDRVSQAAAHLFDPAQAAGRWWQWILAAPTDAVG